MVRRCDLKIDAEIQHRNPHPSMNAHYAARQRTGEERGGGEREGGAFLCSNHTCHTSRTAAPLSVSRVVRVVSSSQRHGMARDGSRSTTLCPNVLFCRPQVVVVVGCYYLGRRQDRRQEIKPGGPVEVSQAAPGGASSFTNVSILTLERLVSYHLFVFHNGNPKRLIANCIKTCPAHADYRAPPFPP